MSVCVTRWSGLTSSDILCYCSLPCLHICPLLLPSLLSWDYSTFVFVSGMQLPPWEVAVVNSFYRFIFFFFIRCPVCCVIVPLWLIVIIFVWSNNRSIVVLILTSNCLRLPTLSFFCCQVVAIVVIALVVSCLLHRLLYMLNWLRQCRPFLWLGLTPSLFYRSAQSILNDHRCHHQIAAVVFPKTSTIGWY